jgi:hypothetical protein
MNNLACRHQRMHPELDRSPCSPSNKGKEQAAVGEDGDSERYSILVDATPA